LNALMAELYCRTTGCSKGKGGSMHLISPDVGLPGSSAIVAGTIPLSVGAALSFSIQGKDSISAAFFGDGATNEGAFYESLNFASLKKLPVIFVCENNLFSTHMPISDCLADTNIAKKADAFGMQGIKIDGNDVLEVHKAAIKAISKARCGGGPTLIECMTYRWRGHVGPNYDLDKGLRNQDELDRWMRRCPIKILENALMDSGFFSEKDKKNIHDEIDVRIKNAISFARESPHPDPDNIEALKGTFKR
jgi:acetoin:2,6-dichlorophenolindophenol oxidoreductase subunit alpha